MHLWEWLTFWKANTCLGQISVEWEVEKSAADVF